MLQIVLMLKHGWSMGKLRSMGRGMGAEHTIPVMELIHRLKKALDKVQFAQQLLHAQTAQQVLSMGLTP
jgi:hypothetical protein